MTTLHTYRFATLDRKGNYWLHELKAPSKGEAIKAARRFVRVAGEQGETLDFNSVRRVWA